MDENFGVILKANTYHRIGVVGAQESVTKPKEKKIHWINRCK